MAMTFYCGHRCRTNNPALAPTTAADLRRGVHRPGHRGVVREGPTWPLPRRSLHELRCAGSVLLSKPDSPPATQDRTLLGGDFPRFDHCLPAGNLFREEFCELIAAISNDVETDRIELCLDIR